MRRFAVMAICGLALLACAWRGAFDDSYFAQQEQPDQYTALLLHCDGTNGATAFPDSSTNNYTVTMNGSVTVDTSTKKFGTGAAAFGRSEDLTVEAADSWSFGTGAFTLEAWVNISATNVMQSVFGRTRDPDQGYYCLSLCTANNGTPNTSQVTFFINDSGWKNKTWNCIVPKDEWHHIALVRSGNSLVLYLDGTNKGTNEFTGSVGSTHEFWVGRGNADNNYTFGGYMDEVRVSKGIARWTADFTPPTVPYSDP